MRRIGNKRETMKRWSERMLLLASLLLLPVPAHATGTGGGVVMLARVADSGDSGSSYYQTNSGSTTTSVQSLFEQYAFLEFRGTTAALTALDSQLLALGSADARLRVSSVAIGAAGSQLDLTLPMSALNGITTWLDTEAIGGGGGVIMCSAGASTPSSIVGGWTGTKIALDFNPIAQSSLLWNTPVEITLISLETNKAVQLTITVTNCGTTVNVKLSPVNSN